MDWVGVRCSDGVAGEGAMGSETAVERDGTEDGMLLILGRTGSTKGVYTIGSRDLRKMINIVVIVAISSLLPLLYVESPGDKGCLRRSRRQFFVVPSTKIT